MREGEGVGYTSLHCTSLRYCSTPAFLQLAAIETEVTALHNRVLTGMVLYLWSHQRRGNVYSHDGIGALANCYRQDRPVPGNGTTRHSEVTRPIIKRPTLRPAPNPPRKDKKHTT